MRKVKASDRELSLAVARILWPEHTWGVMPRTSTAYSNDGDLRFDYSTDDALGKMSVALAEKAESDHDVAHLCACLLADDPHRALAEELVALSNG